MWLCDGAVLTVDVDVESVLLARVASGDEPALAALYDRLSCLAYGLALCVGGDPKVAEDAVLESFLKLWSCKDRRDAAPRRVRSWFLRLVRDLTLDRLRTGGTLHGKVATGAEVPDVFPAEPSEEVDACKERVARLRAVLEEMPPDQRRALEAMYFEGLSSGEVAERERVPVGTLMARIRDGVLKLHVQLRSEAADV